MEAARRRLRCGAEGCCECERKAEREGRPVAFVDVAVSRLGGAAGGVLSEAH
jgi:hypothetical protein